MHDESDDCHSFFEEELETLQSIYVNEINVETKDGLKPSVFSINLHPATAEYVDEQYVRMTLTFTVPEEYPEALPQITIRNARGLLEEKLEEILKQLLSLAENKKGNSMLFEIIEAAKEYLTELNKPSEECAICLYGFSDDDVFIRTECYHYFHSHCLARYSKYTTEVQAKEEDAVCVSKGGTRRKHEPLLCPMCRIPISFQGSEEDYPPPLASNDDDTCALNEEICKLQQKMKDLFEKQIKKGGIINIEAERNKFLLSISNMPSRITGTDATEDVSASSEGADSQQTVNADAETAESKSDKSSPKGSSKAENHRNSREQRYYNDRRNPRYRQSRPLYAYLDRPRQNAPNHQRRGGNQRNSSEKVSLKNQEINKKETSEHNSDAIVCEASSSSPKPSSDVPRKYKSYQDCNDEVDHPSNSNYHRKPYFQDRPMNSSRNYDNQRYKQQSARRNEAEFHNADPENRRNPRHLRFQENRLNKKDSDNYEPRTENRKPRHYRDKESNLQDVACKEQNKSQPKKDHHNQKHTGDKNDGLNKKQVSEKNTINNGIIDENTNSHKITSTSNSHDDVDERNQKPYNRSAKYDRYPRNSDPKNHDDYPANNRRYPNSGRYPARNVPDAYCDNSYKKKSVHYEAHSRYDRGPTKATKQNESKCRDNYRSKKSIREDGCQTESACDHSEVASPESDATASECCALPKCKPPSGFAVPGKKVVYGASPPSGFKS